MSGEPLGAADERLRRRIERGTLEERARRLAEAAQRHDRLRAELGRQRELASGRSPLLRGLMLFCFLAILVVPPLLVRGALRPLEPELQAALERCLLAALVASLGVAALVLGLWARWRARREVALLEELLERRDEPPDEGPGGHEG